MADEPQPENQVIDDSGAGQAESVDPRAPIEDTPKAGERSTAKADTGTDSGSSAKPDSATKDSGSKS